MNKAGSRIKGWDKFSLQIHFFDFLFLFFFFFDFDIDISYSVVSYKYFILSANNLVCFKARDFNVLETYVFASVNV